MPLVASLPVHVTATSLVFTYAPSDGSDIVTVGATVSTPKLVVSRPVFPALSYALTSTVWLPSPILINVYDVFSPTLIHVPASMRTS